MAFPDEREAAMVLVQDHVQDLPDEKVRFAAYYSPGGDEAFILEVLENFGYGEISDSGDLMDTRFKPFGGFERTTSRPVHLVLTNPAEFQVAIEHNWPSVQTLREAAQYDRVKVLVDDGTINVEFLERQLAQ